MENQWKLFEEFVNRYKDDIYLDDIIKDGAGIPLDFIPKNLARPLVDWTDRIKTMKAADEEWERKRKKDVEALKETLRKNWLDAGDDPAVIEETLESFEGPTLNFSELFEDIVNKDKKRHEEEWNTFNEGVKVETEVEEEQSHHGMEMADSNGADKGISEMPEDDEVLPMIVKHELIIEEDEGIIGSVVSDQSKENQGQDVEMAEINAAEEGPNELPDNLAFFIVESEMKDEDEKAEGELTIVRVVSKQGEENQGQDLEMAEMVMNATDEEPNNDNASFFIIKSEIKDEEGEGEGSQVDEEVSEEGEEGRRHQEEGEEETQVHDVEMAEANVPDDRPLDRPIKVTFAPFVRIMKYEPSKLSLSGEQEILEPIKEANAARRPLRKRRKRKIRTSDNIVPDKCPPNARQSVL